MRNYFADYVSNTTAGSGNQYSFTMNEGEIRTGRVFYRIKCGGSFQYSILFSNILDSTFADGKSSHANLICDAWEILRAKIWKASKDAFSGNACVCPKNMTDLCELTFQGSVQKSVSPGEFFCSDPINCTFEAGEYLCLEMTFSGKRIPCHEETILPVFIKQGETWVYSREMPLAGMIGCNRKVNARIGFLGDSITQGIGVEINTYAHWNALLADKLGDGFSYWNLGLGFGRANDLASEGAWLYKGIQNDIVFVCYGVNDLLQGFSEEQIKSDLDKIVTLFRDAGKTVILQTLPPFDYCGEHIEKWKRINLFIKTVLAEKVDFVFDVVPILGLDKDRTHMAKYGGHPDMHGCRVWAEALYEAVNGILL